MTTDYYEHDRPPSDHRSDPHRAALGRPRSERPARRTGVRVRRGLPSRPPSGWVGATVCCSKGCAPRPSSSRSRSRSCSTQSPHSTSPSGPNGTTWCKCTTCRPLRGCRSSRLVCSTKRMRRRTPSRTCSVGIGVWLCSAAPLRLRIGVLSQLAAQDPGNAVWADDLRAFEAVRLLQIQEEAAEAVRHHDSEAISRLVAEVEPPGWSEPPPRSLVQSLRKADAQLRGERGRAALLNIGDRLDAALNDARPDPRRPGARGVGPAGDRHATARTTTRSPSGSGRPSTGSTTRNAAAERAASTRKPWPPWSGHWIIRELSTRPTWSNWPTRSSATATACPTGSSYAISPGSRLRSRPSHVGSG